MTYVDAPISKNTLSKDFPSSTKDFIEIIFLNPFMGFNLLPLNDIALGAKLIPPTASWVPTVIRKTGVPKKRLIFKKYHNA